MTRDKKTKQAIEEGVQAGVESLSASSSSTATSRQPPRRTAKQTAHHRLLLLCTKGDMKKRYSLALKEGTRVRVSRGGSLRKIAMEVNSKYKLDGKWRLTHENLCKYTDPNHHN